MMIQSIKKCLLASGCKSANNSSKNYKKNNKDELIN